MAKSRTWIAFREFFARADRAHIGRTAAAQALLRNIKAPTAANHVRGICRAWEYIEEPLSEVRLRNVADCWLNYLGNIIEEAGGRPTSAQAEAFAKLSEIISAEREEWRELPRPLSPRNVPTTNWVRLEFVSATGVATWGDDPEEPIWWETADLIRGTLRIQIDGLDREEWHSLEIDEVYADQIIAKPNEMVAPYSLRDLIQLIKEGPARNVEIFWILVRDSGRLGNTTQEEIRCIWRRIRGKTEKRGRPRKPR